MEKDKAFERNRPSEKGRDNDPHVRDESALEPGINTVSKSETDPANESLTRTAADDFREGNEDSRADKKFDE